MKSLEATKRQLEYLGLSRREAEIYILLVAHQELRIQEIAKLSGIARSSVYGSVQRLYELGVAEEVVDEHHKRIRPYPLDVIQHDLNQRVAAMQQLSQDLQQLQTDIVQNATGQLSSATTVRYYKDRAGARQILWNSLKTDDLIRGYCEWERAHYVGTKYYENFVLESRRRGIRQRILMNPTDIGMEFVRRFVLPGSPITRTNIDDIHVLDESVMLIKGETIIYGNMYAQVYLKTAEINGFEIENATFSAAQRSLFDNLWNSAKPITAFL